METDRQEMRTMRNFKRFGTVILTLLLASALAVFAFGADRDTDFSDVNAGAWYAEAVQYCEERELMSGVSSSRFAPEGTLTRAQLVTVLYRMEGSPAVTGNDNFSDTDEGKWYSPAVIWAARQGLVSGYGNGLFGVDDPVTQEQLALIFQRYTDAPVTKEIPGFSGTSAPATRAQAAAVLMACGQAGEQPETPAQAEESRVLVAYFSNTGNTEGIAEHLQAVLGAELYCITPETAYTAADLDYTNDSSRANREQADTAVRPAIMGSVEDMEQYDVVFLGYPIWHGQAPRIISTFLESYNFSGKTIVPFCTSGSSSIGSSAENLHSLAPNADWLEGRRFSGGASHETVEDWVSEMNLPETAERQQEGGAAMLNISVNGRTLTASLADNSSARAFQEMLAEGPLTITMSDYASMEKVGALGRNLPANDEQIHTQAGDIILYQGNQITVYYGTNSWNLTRLGKIDGIAAQELKDILGGGDVEMTFSLA